MLNWQNFLRVKTGVAIIFGLSLLTGCADYELEVDAPILSQVGLLTPDKPLPKLKERAPLVVPPTAQLPPPGTRAEAPDDMNWPDDPDVKAKQLAKLKEQQKELEDQKKGPWHKAVNSAFGTGDSDEQAEKQGENPVPDEEKQQSGILDGAGSGAGNSGIDMDQRVEDMIR